MIQFDTSRRVFCTAVLTLLLAEPAFAQSVLNFTRATVNEGLRTGITVINPTSSHADVQFAYYGLDGDLVSTAALNPVSYRLAPKGQLSVLAGELFGGERLDGWIQASSPADGLTGSYYFGDFSGTAEGAEPAAALSNQVIPLIREDSTTRTEIAIVNPGTASANVTITFFNSRGDEVGTVSQNLVPHGAARVLPPASGNLTARISSSVPTGATAMIAREGVTMFASGQPVDRTAAVRFGPHFISGQGFDSSLVLMNPAGAPVTVRVTLFSNTGGAVHPSFTGPSSTTRTIPGNGSVTLDVRAITGLLVAPLVDGWVQVESPNVALAGTLVLDQGLGMTAVPLASPAASRMLFSHIGQTDSLYTGLAFVNPSLQSATVEFSLIAADGILAAQRSITVPANAKFSTLVGTVLPEANGRTEGVLFVRSSAGLYGVAMVGATDGSYLAGMAPLPVPDAFIPAVRPTVPAIARVEPGLEVRPGMELRIAAVNILGELSVLIGGQVVSARLLAPGTAFFVVTVPPIEPGFASLRLRSNGIESDAATLRILHPDNAPVQILSGRAFYRKAEVNDAGLDLSRAAMVPIRSARVEVVDRSSQQVVSVSETDSKGRFRVPVPAAPDLTVRVLSRLRSSELRVLDNTNANTLYTISADVDGRDVEASLLIADNSRVSGAFNILEVVQRGNDTLRMADPRLVPPPVTLYWSVQNTGATFFNLTNNTAFVVGNRASDSDEFDDSVILHEYAHLLAARFSRDDSPGGPHQLGDLLDPRVAWSEGWANFFSGAVRNDPVYRDSLGPNGANVLRYDLEENIPPGDRPGLWSEASIHSLLWDMLDLRADGGDSVQYSLSSIWAAFSDLRNDRFVYVPHFLERFLARIPDAAGSVRAMALFRSIEFQPNLQSSVTNPFPRPMNAGDNVTGEVDSLSSKRSNLMQSAHFRSFATTGGAVSIRLEIVGLGPAANAAANDLDLFLLDANGRVIERSDRGLNGQSELISVRLPAGTYVVEVRSFYTRAETNGLVFNSGEYRLSVTVQ